MSFFFCSAPKKRLHFKRVDFSQIVDLFYLEIHRLAAAGMTTYYRTDKLFC